MKTSKDYMKTYRENPENILKENKSKILRKINENPDYKASIKTLKKYGIVLNEVRNIRIQKKFEPFELYPQENIIEMLPNTNLGWIYVISCKMYEEKNYKKIGFTEKNGLLEEEVKSSLLQRYSTTLLDPSILSLVRVSSPRQAEKKIFSLLEKYRVDKEVFCIDYHDILPALQTIQKDFSPSEQGINKDVLEKLLCRIRKKENKLTKDLMIQKSFCDWIYSNKFMCNNNNQQILNCFLNNLPNPCIVGTNFDWTKRPENQNILIMRKAHILQSFEIHNWDRSDLNLHQFLKNLLNAN
jgi:hypothetical protein